MHVVGLDRYLVVGTQAPASRPLSRKVSLCSAILATGASPVTNPSTEEGAYQKLAPGGLPGDALLLAASSTPPKRTSAADFALGIVDMAVSSPRPAPVGRSARRLGLSLAEVGRAIGADPSTIFRWESGERIPSGSLAAIGTSSRSCAKPTPRRAGECRHERAPRLPRRRGRRALGLWDLDRSTTRSRGTSCRRAELGRRILISKAALHDALGLTAAGTDSPQTTNGAEVESAPFQKEGSLDVGLNSN